LNHAGAPGTAEARQGAGWTGPFRRSQRAHRSTTAYSALPLRLVDVAHGNGSPQLRLMVVKPAPPEGPAEPVIARHKRAV
jgi:hypothetical protein